MYTVVDGNLVPPFLGKVDFLDKTERNVMKRPKYNWNEFYERDLPAKASQVSETDVAEAEAQAAEDDDDDAVLFNADGTFNKNRDSESSATSGDGFVVGMSEVEEGSVEEYADESIAVQNEIREGLGMKPVGGSDNGNGNATGGSSSQNTSSGDENGNGNEGGSSDRSEEDYRNYDEEQGGVSM